LSFSLCPSEGLFSLDTSRRQGGPSSVQRLSVATVWDAWGGVLDCWDGLDVCTLIVSLGGFKLLKTFWSQSCTVLFNTLLSGDCKKAGFSKGTLESVPLFEGRLVLRVCDLSHQAPLKYMGTDVCCDSGASLAQGFVWMQVGRGTTNPRNQRRGDEANR
jgi:hypothetical protein